MTEKEKNLHDLSTAELWLRLNIVTKILREAQQNSDPRWKNLIAQQRRLNEVLVQKIKEERSRKGIPEPEPMVVGMKPVRIAARWINMG